MKLVFPLSLKVSLWLFLNLLVLGAVAAGFLAWRGDLRWESVLADRAGERLHAVAALIGEQVGGAPPADREAMLARFESAYGAEMALYSNDGTRLAGKTDLPAEVRTLCRFGRRPPFFFRARPGPWDRGKAFPDFPPWPPPPIGRDDVQVPASSGEAVAAGSPRPPDGPEALVFGFAGPDPSKGPSGAFLNAPRFAPAARFLVRTEKPPAYWIGFMVPSTVPTAGAKPGRDTGISREGGEALLSRTPDDRPSGAAPPGRGGPAAGESGAFAAWKSAPGVLVLKAGSLWPLLRLLDLEPWLLGVAAAMTLSILFWLPFVRGITRAVGNLTEATGRIAEGRLDTRVPAGRRDEIGRLGDAVNRMAERLDAAATGQRRFLADVAHELCSPLARLQVATGILESKVAGEAAAALEDLREEVQEMGLLVDEVLAFTRAGFRAGKAPAPVDLAPLANRVLVRENLAGRVGLRVPHGLRALGDPDLLARALRNLARNAARYAGPAADIRIEARRQDDRVMLLVEDDGPGVSPEALAHLGEPFYRPEAARTREGGGFGLGLAIVRGCVEACGGDVRFANRQPRGFSAEIRLPAG